MVSETAHAVFDVFAGPRCQHPTCQGRLSKTLVRSLYNDVAYECDTCTRWFYRDANGGWIGYGNGWALVDE